jgi:very-short-patch-repair endonuclease
VLAIEVDGFRFHEDRPEQLRRDALKDSILEHFGIPLLRLATTGSDEERRIREALKDAEVAHLQQPLGSG